ARHSRKPGFRLCGGRRGRLVRARERRRPGGAGEGLALAGQGGAALAERGRGAEARIGLGGAAMVAKVEIVEKLGESAVLLPSLIEEGLAGNDRLKIRLTMLQGAAAQASESGRPAPSLERERRSVGLTDPENGALRRRSRLCRASRAGRPLRAPRYGGERTARHGAAPSGPDPTATGGSSSPSCFWLPLVLCL